MRDRSTTDVCSNRPTSTAPPTKLRSAPAPPRRTPHFARGRSETRPQVTAAAPKKIPKPGTKAHAPSTSNGQLRLADGAGRGSIREVCLPAADRRYSATSAAGSKGRSSPVLVWSDCRRQPGRLEPDIHCKPGGVQTRTHARAGPEMAPGTLSTREASNRGRGNDKRRIARLRADVRPLGDAQARREEQWQDDGREEARHEKPPGRRNRRRVEDQRIRGFQYAPGPTGRQTQAW